MSKNPYNKLTQTEARWILDKRQQNDHLLENTQTQWSVIRCASWRATYTSNINLFPNCAGQCLEWEAPPPPRPKNFGPRASRARGSLPPGRKIKPPAPKKDAVKRFQMQMCRWDRARIRKPTLSMYLKAKDSRKNNIRHCWIRFPWNSKCKRLNSRH